MKILVSAIESSANIHLEVLQQQLPDDVTFVGIFDQRLGKPLYDLNSFAVMGFLDVIKKLPTFFKISNDMVELANDVDKVLLMDSSGFNLPLAKKLKKHYPNLEIIYYILPQAWAWKRGRIKVLEQTIDKLASILPFEPSYYSPTAPITYVGHPLLDEITLQKENLDDHNGTIAFMPGSRKGEIQRLLPLFDELRKKMNKKAVLIIPKQFSDDQIEDIYGEYRQHFELSKTTHETLKKAEFAFICSGTATLEATLIGVPFILAYIANPIDFFIAKKLAHIEHVGLANIMMLQAKEGLVHPEYLQDDVTLENLLNAYHSYDYQNYEKQAKKLKSYLNHGSAKNVAKLILE